MTHTPLPCNHIRQLCLGIMLIIGMSILEGCGASQPVRVLPKDATTLTMSLGGPIVPSSSPVGFIPYTTIGIAHGTSESLTLHGNVHALMAAFGIVGLDGGASWRTLRQHDVIPEVTLTAKAIFFSDLRSLADTRIYPDLAATCSWDVSDGWLAYAGAHGTIQLSNGQFFLSPMIGLTVPVSDRWTLQVEGMWQASNINTQHGIFEGESSVGSNGSIGVFIGGQVTL